MKYNRICEPYGFDENNEYQSRQSLIENELTVSKSNDEKEFAAVEYVSGSNAFAFKNVNGDIKGYAYMKDIIPKDLIKDAKYDSASKSLVITFSNGEVVTIPLGDLIDVTEAGNGLTSDGNVFSVLIDTNSEGFLTVSKDGVRIDGIQIAINAESTRAAQAESQLSNAIQAEFDRAISAETSIQSDIDNEKTRAQSVEDGLQEAIVAEAERASDVENQLAAAINEEGDRAYSAETSLQDAIEAEVERASGVEGELQTAISAEETRATSAERELQNAIDTESGRIDGVAAAIIAEEGRATSAETILNNMISFHIDDSIIHITPEERENWNQKISAEEAYSVFYTKLDINRMLSQIVTRLENVEVKEGVIVADSSEFVTSAPAGSNIVITSTDAMKGLTGDTEFGTLTVVGGNTNIDIKGIASGQITIDGITVNGEKGASNCRFQLSSDTVTIKNVTVESGSTAYNIFESSQNTGKTEYFTKEYHVSGLIVDNTELKHNVLSIYTLVDNAVISVKDSHFNLDADNSNVLRLSNYTNATGVTVTFDNVDWTYENAAGTDWSWAGLIIYQPAATDVALNGDTSKIATWTFNFKNCRYNGEKVTANNFGSHNQVSYLYNIWNTSQVIDSEGVITLNFE